MNSNEKLGPNVKKLLAHFIAHEAIPTGGDIADGMNFILDPDRRRQGAEMAITKLEAALQSVKNTPDNPYGEDNEAIAAAILQRIETINGQRTN